MTLLIDSDIILDLILARESYQESAVDKALIAPGSDFEDALQYAAAEDAGVDALITRNKRDYQKSSLPVYTAEEILRLV